MNKNKKRFIIRQVNTNESKQDFLTMVKTCLKCDDKKANKIYKDVVFTENKIIESDTIKDFIRDYKIKVFWMREEHLITDNKRLVIDFAVDENDNIEFNK